ncbi:MAG: hypothetical protein HOB73_11445 [Planctomycetaceae bacterium]|nr:hypothetical protein [Planctomycetaceae bacterium]
MNHVQINPVSDDTHEVWLHGNRRVYTIALIPGVIILCGSTFVFTNTFFAAPLWLRVIAAVLCGFAGVTNISLLLWLKRPLLGYSGGDLLVYLRPPHVVRVPIEFVEVFFAGQSETHIPRPRRQTKGPVPESRNVVVRLAERASQFQTHPVKPSLGSWEEGYIVVRGTWSEPINKDLFRRLNRRLIEIHRLQKTSVENGHNIPQSSDLGDKHSVTASSDCEDHRD